MTPDPDRDRALSDLERLIRGVHRGRVVAWFEMLDGMVVDYRARRFAASDTERLMREVPCRKEAMAEAKRGRRR